MPFKSEKQRKYLYKNNPKVAREFAAKEKKMGGHKAYMMKMKDKRDLKNGYRKSY